MPHATIDQLIYYEAIRFRQMLFSFGERLPIMTA